MTSPFLVPMFLEMCLAKRLIFSHQTFAVLSNLVTFPFKFYKLDTHAVYSLFGLLKKVGP